MMSSWFVSTRRMDNLIFAVGKAEVVSVLDWELSTLGDPISDLAYCCMAYHLPLSQPHLTGSLAAHTHTYIRCTDQHTHTYLPAHA